MPTAWDRMCTLEQRRAALVLGRPDDLASVQVHDPANSRGTRPPVVGLSRGLPSTAAREPSGDRATSSPVHGPSVIRPRSRPPPGPRPRPDSRHSRVPGDGQGPTVGREGRGRGRRPVGAEPTDRRRLALPHRRSAALLRIVARPCGHSKPREPSVPLRIRARSVACRRSIRSRRGRGARSHSRTDPFTGRTFCTVIS